MTRGGRKKEQKEKEKSEGRESKREEESDQKMHEIGSHKVIRCNHKKEA